MKFGEKLKSFFKSHFSAKSEEQAAVSSEQAAVSSEQVAVSSEQVVVSSEQVADSEEQVADNREQAVKVEQAVVKVEAPVVKAESSAVKVEVPAVKVEPSVEKVEPAAVKVEVPSPAPDPQPALAAKLKITDEFFEDLCDLLIEGDFGAAEAYKITENLKAQCRKIKDADAVHLALADLLEKELLKAKQGEKLFSKTDDESSALTAILILGVNGVGKTTTAAKLAHFFREKYNKKTILAAADTFRAAAIDQLKIHGERLDMRVIAHKHGGDPAAVVYDALEAAQSGGADIIIADTAGRMHTKTALVEELRKIDRVVETKSGAGSKTRYLKYLILDATTGRNAFAQAEIFHDAVALDGVILTKYDSTAKGGVVFSLASQLNLPVVYICTGEKYTDIDYFNPGLFVKEFAGIE